MSENTPGPTKAVNPSLLKPTAVYMFLSYFLWPFSLIGLAIEKEDDLIRFNCAQSMALLFLQLAVVVVLYPIAMLLTLILIGWLFVVALWAVQVAIIVFTVIALVKASKGEKYMIPLVGPFAEKTIKKWLLK